MGICQSTNGLEDCPIGRLPKEQFFLMLSYLDSRSRNLLFRVLSKSKSTSPQIRKLAELDQFSRLQHREMLVLRDIHEHVPGRDRSFCCLPPPPLGMNHYGDDLFLDQCHRTPYDTPNDFSFYCRIRYNGSDTTSYVERVGCTANFLFVPINDALDEWRLWPYWRCMYDALVLRCGIPFSQYGFKEIFEGEEVILIPHGYSISVVCSHKKKGRPLLTALGVFTTPQIDAFEFPIRPEVASLIHEWDRNASMIYWVSPGGDSLDEDGPCIGIVVDDIRIIGLGITYKHDSIPWGGL